MWPPQNTVATDTFPFPPAPGKMASLIDRSHRAGFTAEEWNFEATRRQFQERTQPRKENATDNDLQALSRYRVHAPKGWRFFGPEHIAAGKAPSIHSWRQRWPRASPAAAGEHRNAQTASG